MSEHLHTLELDTIEPIEGAPSRRIRAHCTTCPETFEQITLRTDAEIHAAITEANAEAADPA